VQDYDPLEAPDPEEWMALDEQERIDLVRDYHRRAGIRLPNEKLHATLHAIVEAQIALGDETPAGRIAQRLISEGLDRHDAIHAHRHGARRAPLRHFENDEIRQGPERTIFRCTRTAHGGRLAAVTVMGTLGTAHWGHSAARTVAERARAENAA